MDGLITAGCPEEMLY
ncbi:unnamed protein product [Knipowitschia caucasica]